MRFFFGHFCSKPKNKSCVNRVLKYALQWEITHEAPAAALWTKFEAFGNMWIYGASVLQKETLGGRQKHGWGFRVTTCGSEEVMVNALTNSRPQACSNPEPSTHKQKAMTKWMQSSLTLYWLEGVKQPTLMLYGIESSTWDILHENFTVFF